MTTTSGESGHSVTTDATLAAYLSGQQDGQEWALIDNLRPDDVREVAKAAIALLRDANACVACSALALDGMTPRAMRFQARDAALAFIDPYIARLSAIGLGVPSCGRDGNSDV